ncbi:hypothetical protein YASMINEVIRUS_760, partial [Yasminevirus sp. GU-2018]
LFLRLAHMSGKVKFDVNSKNKAQKSKKVQNEEVELTEEEIEFNKKKQEQHDLVNKFNYVVINMIDHITEYYGDSNMAKLKLFLTNLIVETPDEPIACFLLNVYKNDDYRTNILKQNDKFFVDEIDNNSDTLSQGDDEKVTKLFEFKELWTQIDTDTKTFIKKSMMALVKICSKYVLAL